MRIFKCVLGLLYVTLHLQKQIPYSCRLFIQNEVGLRRQVQDHDQSIDLRVADGVSRIELLIRAGIRFFRVLQSG
jgi:hypothetical protein